MQINETQLQQEEKEKISNANKEGLIKQEITIKLVFLGEAQSGKTSIIQSFLTNEFPLTYVPTVFDTFQTKYKLLEEKSDQNNTNNKNLLEQEINIQFMQALNKLKNLLTYRDSAGYSEIRKKIRQIKLPKDPDVLIIVFDLTNRKSFNEAIGIWYKKAIMMGKSSLKVFIGNKLDQRFEYEIFQDSAESFITYEEAEKIIIKELKCLYFEVSALTQQNLKYAFEKILKESLKRYFVINKQIRTASCDIF